MKEVSEGRVKILTWVMDDGAEVEVYREPSGSFTAEVPVVRGVYPTFHNPDLKVLQGKVLEYHEATRATKLREEWEPGVLVSIGFLERNEPGRKVFGLMVEGVEVETRGHGDRREWRERHPHGTGSVTKEPPSPLSLGAGSFVSQYLVGPRDQDSELSRLRQTLLGMRDVTDGSTRNSSKPVYVGTRVVGKP